MMLNVVGTCNVTLGTSSLFGKRILHGYGKTTKYWTQYAFHTIISFPQQYHDLITLAMDISRAIYQAPMGRNPLLHKLYTQKDET